MNGAEVEAVEYDDFDFVLTRRHLPRERFDCVICERTYEVEVDTRFHPRCLGDRVVCSVCSMRWGAAHWINDMRTGDRSLAHGLWRLNALVQRLLWLSKNWKSEARR